MKAIGLQLGRTVLDNSVSIFLTIALFISYVVILAGMPATLTNYLAMTAIICLLYWPVIGFALLRKWLQEKLSAWVIISSWIFSFIVYPALLISQYQAIDLSGFPLFKTILDFGLSRFLISLGVIFLLTEMVLQSRSYISNWDPQQSWLQKISLEKGILAACLLLALLLGVVGWFEIEYIARSDASSRSSLFIQFFQFVSYTFQFFLILLAYYFFYYSNHYFLIKVILKEKGIIYYGFSVAAIILVCYPILVQFIRFLPIVEELSIGLFVNDHNLFAEDGGGIPFTIMISSAPIIISNQWFRQHRAIAELEKEKTEGELGLLKQQINPHFFFNTLNNLYALSLTKDQRTPKMILQLSELMRYVIYRCKEKTVSLQEEIKYIQDYLQLQGIRMHRKFECRFDIDVEDQDLRIPPLLFIILVENAFKHGVEAAENDGFLHIRLASSDQQLIFSCKNSVERKREGDQGIGLKNLKRRLELLYPQQHDLVIREDGPTFTAIIKLDL